MTPLTTLQIGAGWFPENPGGLDRYYYELLRALPRVGVDFRGLVIGTARVASESGGRVHAFARRGDSLLKRWLAARDATARALSELGHRCLVSAHFSLYAHPALRVLMSRGRKMVVHFHGPWATESREEGSSRFTAWMKSRVESSVYRHAAVFITLSSAFKDLLCREYGIDAGRVYVIPGGVDVERFQSAAEFPRTEARLRLGLPTDRPIVLSVRRLVSRVGLENLINSMDLVRANLPDALCVIAGRGRLRDQLEAQIFRLGLESHVRLLGFVSDEDLPRVYRAADFSIMPSLSLEGFGLSAVESLATGTPVLVTPVGGLPEVVCDLDPKLVTTGSHPRALADAICLAIHSPSVLPARHACIDYARRRFSWPIVARRVRDVYESALN